MKMKGKNILELEFIIEVIVYFIIVIKILFLLTSIGHLILSHTRHQNDKIIQADKKFLGWKSKIEFIFTILMSCLLIFIFTPWYDNTHFMTSEMKFLFYLFGFILILSADWSIVLPKTSIGEVVQYSMN